MTFRIFPVRIDLTWRGSQHLAAFSIKQVPKTLSAHFLDYNMINMILGFNSLLHFAPSKNQRLYRVATQELS